MLSPQCLNRVKSGEEKIKVTNLLKKDSNYQGKEYAEQIKLKSKL